MPWQTIFRSLGGAEGGSLGGLIQAIRNALGLPAKAGVERAAFTAAVVALSAKLSKSDGVALKIEEETFEKLFRVEPEEAENVRWLFKLAAKDTAGFEAYAGEVAGALENQADLKHDVFEALLHIASADGILHPGEDRYLSEVAGIFGYASSEYGAMRARFVRDASDPYEVLGAGRDLDNDALKAHYRDVVRRTHPDALAGRGYSGDMVARAERKLAAVNAAWDVIARERGL